ncbi:hypothetical protein LV779_11050 [Streptomyces thinghirensis]|nr:hypothetical protein [Streptomyces thinghirensis]
MAGAVAIALTMPIRPRARPARRHPDRAGDQVHRHHRRRP